MILAAAPVLAQTEALRQAYFGEQRVHTSWSLDFSLGFGDRLAKPEEFRMVYVSVAGVQCPILETSAGKIIQKYDQLTCEHR